MTKKAQHDPGYELRRTRTADRKAEASQDWTLTYEGGAVSWEVDAFHHKPMNVLSLKSSGHKEFRHRAEALRLARLETFAVSPMEDVVSCPVCLEPADHAIQQLVVFGVAYMECQRCSHIFTARRLTSNALLEFYRSDDSYQSTYADVSRAQKRIEGIYQPKLEWTLRRFTEKYGRRPNHILDIGAGSGHFVACCRDSGVKCTGLEPSEGGARFARDHFDIELLSEDAREHLECRPGHYDLITCWGLIEHVPNPVELVKLGSDNLDRKSGGMLVGSVPRWSSVSTSAQSRPGSAIVRHLDPLGHIQVFTDTSLAALHARAGLDLKSVWYFGMDSYELSMQHSLLTQSNALLQAGAIDSLQAKIDYAEMSDSIVFASVPSLGTGPG